MHRIMQKYRISNHSVAVFYTCYVYNMQLNSCSLKHDCLNKSVNRKASQKTGEGSLISRGTLYLAKLTNSVQQQVGEGNASHTLRKTLVTPALYLPSYLKRTLRSRNCAMQI